MYQMENKNYIQGIGHKIVFQIIIDRFKMKKKPSITSNSLINPSLKCSSKSSVLLLRSGIITTLVGHFTSQCSLVELWKQLFCLSNSCDFAEASGSFLCIMGLSRLIGVLDGVANCLIQFSSAASNSSYAFSSWN